MLSQAAQLRALTKINTQDFLTSFGLDQLAWGQKTLEFICRYPSRRFARQMIDYDRRVGEEGLKAASQQTLKGFTENLEISGQEHIPSHGPLLVVSNHPGMTDTLALFACLPREDLCIVAAERPFLQALPHVSQHLIYVSDDSAKRMGVVRAVTDHLRQGGAVLTFPAGQIEPDPAAMPGAVEALRGWAESIAVFVRLVPQLQILPTLVSGVIWPVALHHPLTHLRRQQKDRERLGASLQVLIATLLPNYRPVNVRVAFGAPLLAADLARLGDAASITRSVTEQMRRLIEMNFGQSGPMHAGQARRGAMTPTT